MCHSEQLGQPFFIESEFSSNKNNEIQTETTKTAERPANNKLVLKHSLVDSVIIQAGGLQIQCVLESSQGCDKLTRIRTLCVYSQQAT